MPVVPGQLTFRNGYERSLAELVTPMSEYNWTHNFTQFFNGGAFEDPL